jgi:hypothetical protein
MCRVYGTQATGNCRFEVNVNYQSKFYLRKVSRDGWCAWIMRSNFLSVYCTSYSIPEIHVALKHLLSTISLLILPSEVDRVNHNNKCDKNIAR